MRLQKPQCGRKHYAGIRKDLSKALLGRRKVGETGKVPKHCG